MQQPLQKTALIDRAIFFDNPTITNAKLSPDGRYITFVKALDDVKNIWIKLIDQPFEEAFPLTNDKRPITGYFWSRDSQHILYVQDKLGDENFHVYKVKVDTASAESIPEAINLTPYPGVRAMIFRIAKQDDDLIFVGLNDRDPAWHDLYSIRISTGEKTLILQNDQQFGHYVFDLNDKLRLAGRANAEGGNDLLSMEDGEWTERLSVGLEEMIMPHRFHPDGSQIYLETNQGENNDLSTLYLWDYSTGNKTIVHQDPEKKVDFGGVVFSRQTDEILYTVYDGEEPRYYFFNDDVEKDFELIRKKLSEYQIAVTSSTKLEDKWLIVAYSDRDPGATYLYDRNSKELTFLFHPRPELPISELSHVQSVRYPSSDGLQIPAYLTLPQDYSSDSPAILLIHGGPWHKDSFGYQSTAQFLANRGYVILQPNFRSSTGFGKSFLNAGNLEWGKKMQDDITFGVHFLVENGYADRAKIGIMGGSYGGYATLAALAFTPDVFAVGVDIVGPSNLFTLMETIPPYWESGRKMLYKRVGDPDTEEGREILTAASPLFHADKITAPLMIVQGANDPRVKQAEADQIARALRDRNFPVEYLMAKDEGHGFRDPVNNMAFLAAAEKFLSKHLGGRYQDDMPDHIQERLETLKVDVTKI